MVAPTSRRPVCPRQRKDEGSAVFQPAESHAGQLTFRSAAHVLLMRALDTIFVLAAIVRQLLDDLICSLGCVDNFVSIRSELYNLPHTELVHSIIAPAGAGFCAELPQCLAPSFPDAGASVPTAFVAFHF